MSLAALMMCALSVILWLLENKTPAGKWPAWVRRLIVGVMFGGAAVLSTHYGINYGSMVLNVRDMAPLSAGLFFDPWAGLIAGLIGGAERFLAGEYLSIGTFSSLACSISTALAGILAGLCRKFLFEGKKPSPFYAFALGALMEVFHMLMVLLTHMDDMSEAFHVVRVCTVPMVAFSALGLLVTAVVFSALSGRRLPRLKWQDRSETPITKRFQVYLLIFVTVMMLCTFTFTYVAETRLTLQNAASLMRLHAADIEKEIRERDANLVRAVELMKTQALFAARAVAQDVAAEGGVNGATNERLAELTALYDIYEINVVDSRGIIVASTNAQYIGFDMSSGAQSVEFLTLLDGELKELVQDFQPIAFDSSVSVMYAGVTVPEGFIQVGYDDEDIALFESLADIGSLVADRHIGEAGYAFLADEDGHIVSKNAAFKSDTFWLLGVPAGQRNGVFFATIEGGEYYCYLTKLGNYRALLVMGASKLYQDRDIFAYETALMELLVFAAVFGLIFVLVRRIIIRNLERVNASLARITGGNLDEVVSVRESAEFSSLSADINSTVAALKRYIAEAENRINAELEFARAIQISSLPGIFPPYPERKEFELFACMDPAKEVGGDFYDFFFVDENRLALVIADVSGKGIPAALFMMKSKTLIKSLAESGISPANVLETANRKLCEGNDAQMFVTAWLGILDTRTGLMCCANAGHEYPALKRADGSYELYHDKHGFVLGGMDGVRYHEYELTLGPGDKLFLYTDGVTEATDAQNGLFGTDRLLAALDHAADARPEDTLYAVTDAIDGFVAGAPQFDDITMLGLMFMPAEMPAVLRLKPKGDVAARAVEFAETYFTDMGVPHGILVKLNIAVDEIVTNIVSYSGADEFSLSCLYVDGKATLRFGDDGAPYDPLQKADPDVALTAGERPIGGLGVFMVKKFMDSVSYENRGGRNLLTVEKTV